VWTETTAVGKRPARHSSGPDQHRALSMASIGYLSERMGVELCFGGDLREIVLTKSIEERPVERHCMRSSFRFGLPLNTRLRCIMGDQGSNESIEVISKLLLESFSTPLDTIAAELERLECVSCPFPSLHSLLMMNLTFETPCNCCISSIRQSQAGWLARIDVENSKFLQTDQALKEAIVLVCYRGSTLSPLSDHLANRNCLCLFYSSSKYQPTLQSCKP